MTAGLGCSVGTNVFLCWYCWPPDPGRDTRSLNLHLAVSQPGSFCCDDGTCIPSELVCDGDSDCSDQTDERSCEMVQLPVPYSKQAPPRHYTAKNIKICENSITFYTFYITLHLSFCIVPKIQQIQHGT